MFNFNETIDRRHTNVLNGTPLKRVTTKRFTTFMGC